MGAYYSLIAFQNEPLQKALFLSPVVDMKRLIENMMTWFDVITERLKEEQVIDTPIGETLYWDYYSYVLKHPIVKWQTKTAILYGEKDEVSEKTVILTFSKQFGCDLEVVPESEHYFYTPSQLNAFSQWLESKL